LSPFLQLPFKKDPPLLELFLLDTEALGERKPAELGVRDREAAGFENVLPSVAVVLLACPLAGERPLSDDLAARGE